MADSPADKTVGCGSTRSSCKIALCSSFPKQISLYDWWLTKNATPSNGRGLGVGGVFSTEKLGIRVFQSAAILKRHNAITVETADGFIITVTNSINMPRTVGNGLPPEVCNHFLFGFPYYWEEFASQFVAGESTNGAVNGRLSCFSGYGVSSADGSKSFLPKSFDNLPGVLLRDFCLLSPEISGSCKLGKSIFEDVMQAYSGNSLKHKGQSTSPNEEMDVMTRDSGQKEICSNPKKRKNEQRHNGEDDGSGAKSRKVKFPKINSERGTPTYAYNLSEGPSTRSMSRSYANDSSSRPSTRSMSRLKIAMDKQEKNTFLSSLGKSQLRESHSVSEASGKQSARSLMGSNSQLRESLSVSEAPGKLNEESLTVSKSRLRKLHFVSGAPGKQNGGSLTGSKNQSRKSLSASEATGKQAPGKQYRGSLTGSNVSVESPITRKLALRNRSIDLHI